MCLGQSYFSQSLEKGCVLCFSALPGDLSLPHPRAGTSSLPPSFPDLLLGFPWSHLRKRTVHPVGWWRKPRSQNSSPLPLPSQCFWPLQLPAGNLQAWSRFWVAAQKMEGVGEGVGDGRCKEGLVGGRLPGSHSAPAGRNGKALGWAKIQMLKKGRWNLRIQIFRLTLLSLQS